MIFNYLGKRFYGSLLKEKYRENDSLALELVSWEPDGEYWEPFSRLSVNVDASLEEHEFVAKTYSENEGICEEIARLGYIEPTGEFVGMDPVYKLTQKFLDEESQLRQLTETAPVELEVIEVIEIPESDLR